ncbi:MAG: choice-of-anchor tandem repeat NxxGxxAF-containing protein [Planctomycetota bacterium]
MIKHVRRQAIVTAAVFALPMAWCGTQTADASVVRSVAVRGQAAPGVAGYQFQQFSSNFISGGAVINSSGDVAFYDRLLLTGGSGQNLESVWVERNGVLDNVALEGQSVAGSSGFVHDDIMGGRFVLDDAGRLAHATQINNGPSSSDVRQAILVYDPVGGSRTVVRSLTQTPQADPISPTFGWEFSSLGPGANFITEYGGGTEFVFNNNTTGFSAGISNPSGAGTASGLWVETPRGTPTGLVVAARNGPGSSFFPSGTPAGMSGAGDLLFNTSIDPGDDPTFNAIVYYNGGINLIVRNGGDSGLTFTNLDGRPATNSLGNTAWKARLFDTGQDGIFKQSPGDPDGIVTLRDAIAGGTPDLNMDGTPDFTYTNSFSSPLMNGNNHVVFTGAATNGSQTVRGIWSDRSGGENNLDLVALTGMQAPGLPDGATFFQFFDITDRIVFNDNDDVAFLANVSVPGEALRTGLFAEKNGELELVAATRTDFTLPDGNVVQPTSISFLGGSGNGDGQLSGFSNNGEVAFSLFYSGGGRGVFVANLNTPGDANGDDDVDLLDFLILRSNFGSNNATFDTGDFNGDRVVNLADFLILRENFGAGPGAAPPISAVPEPAMAGGALLSLLALRRRRSA